MNIEHRSYHGELRAAEDEGIIEGYASVWNIVDSYNSSIQRGAFSKTLQERGGRVKVLWNHGDEVIGVPVEMREDDTGLFVRAKLNMNVQRAREVFDLVKTGAIDTFSIGFKTIKDKWVNGVRNITEVALYEFSPVIFEANPAAMITGVRNMDQRAQEYNETFAQYELGRRGFMIQEAMLRTLDDIWYGESDADMLQAKITDTLSKFSAAYSQYVVDVVATWQSGEQRAIPDGDEVAVEFRKHLAAEEMSPEQFAATTVFTLDEVRGLQRGNADIPAEKAALLPESVRTALASARAGRIETLCKELRTGITPAERERINGLINPPQEHRAVDDVVAYLNDFRNQLRG